MSFSMKRDLDSQTKLFTALGFGDKQATEPFLESARDLAYSSHRTDTISLTPKGEAVVKSVVDGKAKESSVIDFTDSEVKLPKSMDYNVAFSNGEKAHVDLSASIFGDRNTFHVVANDRIIDGTATTQNGITESDETIKDAAGNVLLKGHTVTDITKNPNDFERTTDFKSASGEPLGSVKQHVTVDKDTNTMTAETWIARN